LADAGYIAINKVKKGRRSVTLFEITELGRDRLRLHVTKLQQILGAGAESPARRPTKGPEGAKQAKQPTREAKKQAAKRSKKRSGPPARRPDDSAVWL
jgi:DNA-binding PadR family transcriptional regulator